jgi:hypothetical protein
MSSAQWWATREALGETARRFTEQLEGVRDPGAGAVGKWSVSDAAAHVYKVSIVNSLLVTGDQPPDDLRTLYESATTVTVDRVRDLNALALNAPARAVPDGLGIAHRGTGRYSARCHRRVRR